MSDEESSSSNGADQKFKKVHLDISVHSVDVENYFGHRKSKHSTKDYASAPYYQYSCTNSSTSTSTNSSRLNSNDKLNKNTSQSCCCQSTNTTNSYLYTLSQEKHQLKINQSTSTDGLLDEFIIGCFTKQQLLSSQSLYQKKTSPSVSLEPNKYSQSAPIHININTKIDARAKIPMAKAEPFERIITVEPVTSKPATSTTIITTTTTNNDNNNKNKVASIIKSANLKSVLNNDEEEKWMRLKMGPKKSSEWSIFKSKTENAELFDSSSESKKVVGKSPTIINISSVTTTTTTTTTTTKKSSAEDTSVANKEVSKKEITEQKHLLHHHHNPTKTTTVRISS